MSFNEKEYKSKWEKNNRSTFSVRMPKDEMEEVINFLKNNGITRIEMIRFAYNKLKKEKRTNICKNY